MRLALAIVALIASAASAGAQTVPIPQPNAGTYGAYNSVAPTCVSGSGCWLQTDVNGNLKVAGSFSSTPSTGTTTMATAAPTAGTFSSLLASNPSRKACLIQNTGTTLGYIYPAAAGGTTANAFQIQAGGTFSCVNGGTTLTDAITGTCASGTCAFVISSQ